MARIGRLPFYRPVLTERDFRPSINASNPRVRPRAWIGVDDALTIGEASPGHGFYKEWLIRHAAGGQLRTWASHLDIGETAWSGGEIAPQFWVECQHSKVRDWRSGDFEVVVDGRFTVRVSGVKFFLKDLQTLYPKAFAAARKALAKKAARPPRSPPVVESVQPKGGRKLSPSWPQWVAEVVADIHENGIPEGEGSSGVDVMLQTIADRLAERGLEGPARTTSQETMRAVLLRLRGAGN